MTPRVRLALPQPFEDLGHTADLGLRVRGATAEEALARLALALGAAIGGEGPFTPEREEPLSVVVAGGDATATALAFLRELLFRFATDRLLPCACEVTRAGAGRAEGIVAFARWDPDRTGGADVKAVTWHAARLEPEGDGWVGQVVLDV